MAIVRSNGILFVDSIPLHTPTGNQARIAVMTDLSQLWIWNGTVWYPLSISWDILTGATYLLDDTVDIQVQENGIGRIWRSLGGPDQEYIEFGADGLKILQSYNGEETRIRMNQDGIEIVSSEGIYRLGDTGFYALTAPAAQTGVLVYDSATARIGQKPHVLPVKEVIAVMACVDNANPTTSTIKNSTGGNLQFERSAEGNYDVTSLNGSFTANKTYISAIAADGTRLLSGDRLNTSVVRFESRDRATGSFADIIGNLYIKIEVYP